MRIKIPKWVKEWIAILLAIIIATLVLGSCREARELKKDDKAMFRILTKPELSKRANAELSARFPCQNFIVKTEYKEGKTVEVPVLVFDSSKFKRVSDSLTNAFKNKTFDSIPEEFLSECNKAVADAYKTGYDQAIYECNQRPIPIRVDTVLHTEADLKRIDQLEGERDINYGMYQQADKQATTADKLAKNRLLWLIGICVAIGLLIIGWIWAKFRSPLKK